MIAILLIALVAQAAPQRDTRALPAAAAAGSISGVITTDDSQPRPLRRAHVTLRGVALEVPRTVITGDDGSFAFAGLASGSYTLLAVKDGYVSMAYGGKRPGRPGTSVVVTDRPVRAELRLPRGAVITGTVLDIDGQPAVGVAVSALYPRILGAGERQYVNAPGIMPAFTDDRGAYRIYGLPAGEYIVSAQPSVRQPAGGQAAEVRLMLRGGAVSRPMVLAQVLHPGVTDLSRASRLSLRAGEERGGIDLQLEYVPLATVSGTVASPAGWSPARVTLWRTDETTQPQSGPVASADEQGRFVFRAVRPGHYRVAARSTPLGGGGRGGTAAGEVHYGFADIAVSGEDVDGVALGLQPGLSISGQVVFESSRGVSPALPATLRLPAPAFLNSASGGWPLPAVIVEGTRFRIDGIVPGGYRMMTIPQGVRAPIGSWWLTSIVAGGRELLDAPLNLQQSAEDAVVTFADRASEVAGSVRDAAGTAVTDAWVVVFPADRARWFPHSRRIAAVRLDREGRYSIRNLPPGDYRLAATADLQQNEWFDPAVLDALVPAATPLRIGGPEKLTTDVVIR